MDFAWSAKNKTILMDKWNTLFQDKTVPK